MKRRTRGCGVSDHVHSGKLRCVGMGSQSLVSSSQILRPVNMGAWEEKVPEKAGV